MERFLCHINKLVGKYFYLSSGDGYHTGVIEQAIETSFLLLRTDPVLNGAPSLLRLVDLVFFSCEDDDQFCALFDTKEELDSWVLWLDTPSDKEPKLKVIHLRGKEEAKPEGMV